MPSIPNLMKSFHVFGCSALHRQTDVIPKNPFFGPQTNVSPKKINIIFSIHHILSLQYIHVSDIFLKRFEFLKFERLNFFSKIQSDLTSSKFVGNNLIKCWMISLHSNLNLHRIYFNVLHSIHITYCIEDLNWLRSYITKLHVTDIRCLPWTVN